MRSKLDEKSETGRSVRRRSVSPKGGKALQRLLVYLGERDPAMIGEVVATAVPKVAHPKVGPAQRALRAAPSRAARSRPARPHPASKAFAAAITKAARKVGGSRSRTR